MVMSLSPLRSLSLPSRIGLNTTRFQVWSRPFQSDFIAQIRFQRDFHSSRTSKDRSFTNLLADDTPPAVHVSSISENGIQLLDGLVVQGPCVFLEGKVFLWDVPGLDFTSRRSEEQWKGWTEEKFEVFKVVTPRPEILLLGTGKLLVQPPSVVRTCLRDMGIQLDVMDTRNACSTYNLLAEEGRHVAAALLPLSSHRWQKTIVDGKTSG